MTSKKEQQLQDALRNLDTAEARIKELEAELSRANCKYCNKPLTRHNPYCCVKHEVEARK